VTVTPRPARHVVRFFLETTGYSGICLPPFGIFILPDRLMQRSLVLHEQCHWHQAERMGLLRWAITYLWYNLRYGYYDNPFEIEAREFARNRYRGSSD
jgi:hypothetical protein